LLADKLLMAVYADGGDRLKNKHFKKIDEVAPRPAWRWGLLSGAAVLATSAYLAGAYWTPWIETAATPSQVVEAQPESTLPTDMEQTDTQGVQANNSTSATSESQSVQADPSRAAQSVPTAQKQTSTQAPLEEAEVAPAQQRVTMNTDPGVTPQTADEGQTTKNQPSPENADTPATSQTSKPAKPPKASKPSETQHKPVATPDQSPSASTIQENYQAWSQSLSMDASNFLKLLTMHENLKKYTKQVHAQKLFLLMAPQPVKTFRNAYGRLMDRLSWDNRAHVYAYVTFENLKTGEAYYQWVYDPRASQTPVLKRKLQQIEALTQTQSGEIVSAKALNAIIEPQR